MPELIKRFLPFISLLVLCLIVATIEPRFLSPGNLASVARQTTVITIMAMGMTMVMVAGGIDLSVGSLLALAGVSGALVMTTRGNSLGIILAGIAVCITVGLLGGLLNGIAVTRLKIPPFIVTLGALGIYRGIALLLTDGNGVVNLPENFGKLAEGTVLGIPVPLLIVVAIALITHFLLTSTQPGSYCYAIGSNIEAARYAGIRVTRYQILFYGMLGALTGLAGAIETARLVTGVPTAGEGYELNVIAAVVIGGGSLSGGQGTVIGTLIGSLIMGVLSNGANLLGISPFIQKIVIGTVIVMAVTFDEFQRRKFETAE
jgi:ribose transport system permease protein